MDQSLASKIFVSFNYTDNKNILSSVTLVLVKTAFIKYIIILDKLYLFYFYVHPPDWQKSDGGAIHRASNYPTCFRKCHDISVCLKLNRDMTEFRTACHDHQAGKSAVK